MREYRDRDGWWSEGRVPDCWECKDPINSPEELRRYYGQSLHPYCFKQVYQRDNHTGVMQKYWSSVSRLEFSSSE